MAPADAVQVIDWVARFDELAARRDALTAGELDALGLAAWFLGREAACERAWDDAHLAYLDAGDTDAAIRCVFWLGFTLADHGEAVRAGAWMSRLFELADAAAPTPGNAATAALCRAVGAFASGRIEASVDLGEQAVELARLARDVDTEVLATMGLGRALVYVG
ncbi:MAG: hypothetical protein ACRDT9_17660, partial [Agromyces sp.]